MLGKNQQALLTFLEKHPDRWHRIKRRKAINAAKLLRARNIGVEYGVIGDCCIVMYSLPQLLKDQA